jgi:hypothetical protein
MPNEWVDENERNAWTKELLQLHLDTFVPLRVREILESGGVDSLMFERARGLAIEIGSHGDAILFSVKRKTSEMMGKLVEAVAVLSFAPGGITIFGLHFDAEELRKLWEFPELEPDGRPNFEA